MYARAEDDRVRIEWILQDPEVYIKPLTELDEAIHDYQANVSSLSTSELRPFQDRVHAAEGDVEDLFTETYTIEQAERLSAALFGAIVQAKANDGRFL